MYMVINMKKLDNRGWGLSLFLTFIGVFFVAIILVAHLSTKYGIGPTNTDTSSKNNSIIQEYKEYEMLVKEASVKYQEHHYPIIDNGDSFYVNIDKLDIDKDILNKCSGYVEFGMNNDIYYYSPYLHCGNYKTSGYISSLDK